MICPECSTANPEQARFCVGCGHPLPRLCPVCGTANPPDARFCNQCGTRLAAPGEPVATSAASVPAVPALASPAGPPLPMPTAASGSRRRRASLPPSVAAELAEELAEQRRVVTILFADLTSSTALAERLDPEEMRALLGAFFGVMARAIHRHGGTIEKYIGDAVMAIFGLPSAHEDDPLRAVRAALDMQGALTAFNASRREQDPAASELVMRIGINTGEVAAAGIAQSRALEGGDFLITGDAVNVAARLQQAAAPGSVLVGPRTYRGTHGALAYEELPAIALHGRSRPLRVWRALGESENLAPAQRTRGLEALRAPLVGRDGELALLRAVAARALGERHPSFVTVLGAPGIGKSRFVREFLTRLALDQARRTAEDGARAPRPGRRAHDMAPEGAPPPLVIEGRCPPYGEGLTYWPLTEMLRSHCGVTAQDAPEQARARLLTCVAAALRAAGRDDDPEVIAAYLGHTIGIESAERRATLLPGEPPALVEGQQRAWRVFFEALAVPRGLVVLIEDMHWADDALLDLLEAVAARATAAPLLLLGTARPELLERRPQWGGGRGDSVTIALDALSPAEAQQLVRRLLPGAGIPESLRQGILDKAEGNPFYIEEIIHMLVDRAILAQTKGDGWHVATAYAGDRETYDPAIPDTLQGVLLARLDLLSPEERDALQHAAVIGRYFWPGALRHLAPHLESTDLHGLLAGLAARELIHQTERERSSIAPSDEPVYTFNHALIREVAYATIPRARRASEHARVAEWLEGFAAGREAEFADLLAQHYRAYYLQAGLDHSTDTGLREEVLDKVLRYLLLAGEQAASRHAALKAERSYTEALALLGDAPARARGDLLGEVYARRGEARWLAFDADGAWADYRAALAPWSASAPEAQPGSGAHVAWCARGLRLYRRLVQLPTRYPSSFHQLPPHEELREYLDAGLRLAEQAGVCDTEEYAALLTARAFFWWSWPERRGERELLEALRSAREAVRLMEAHGNAAGASEALDALGNIQAITTDLRGYRESEERRLRWAERIEDTSELVDIHGEVSLASQMTGAYATAIEHARTALALADAAEADPLRAQALRALLLASFEWDHWDEALEAGERLLAIAAGLEVRHSKYHQWALLALAVTHARRGQREAADRLARLARLAEERPGAEQGQYLGVFRGRLAQAHGKAEEARAIWLAALDDRSGRHSLAMLQAELAELAARTGDAALWERFGAQAVELGWRSGARKALAQAIRARGIAALAASREDDALADAQSALARFQQLGTAWEEARTRLALAACYRRHAAEGDADRAEAELRRAQSLFGALRATHDAARARAALAGADPLAP